MLLLLGITVLLVFATIILVLKLLDQSERHVKAVRDMKVTQDTDNAWAPQATECDLMVKRDLEENPLRTEAKYRLEVTEKGMEYLEKMQNLRILVLSGCSVQDKWLRHIQKLPLRQIDLSDSDVGDGGVPYLAKIPTLTELLLSNCSHVTDLSTPTLCKMTALHRLSLEGTGVTNNGIKNLRGLTNLDNLSVCNTPVNSGAFDDIATLTNLHSLYFSFNTIELQDISKLKALSKLDTLSMPRCKLNDDCVEVLATIPVRVLDLSGNPFTGKGLMALAKNKPLRALIIDGCAQIGDGDIAKFRKAAPKCNLSHGAGDSKLDKWKDQYKDLM